MDSSLPIQSTRSLDPLLWNKPEPHHLYLVKRPGPMSTWQFASLDSVTLVNSKRNLKMIKDSAILQMGTSFVL